jgi:hypothetical protein
MAPATQPFGNQQAQVVGSYPPLFFHSQAGNPMRRHEHEQFVASQRSKLRQ